MYLGVLCTYVPTYKVMSAPTSFQMAREQSIPSSVALSLNNLPRDELIMRYAEFGYNTREIQSFLSDVHGITVRLVIF